MTFEKCLVKGCFYFGWLSRHLASAMDNSIREVTHQTNTDHPMYPLENTIAHSMPSNPAQLHPLGPLSHGNTAFLILNTSFLTWIGTCPKQASAHLKECEEQCQRQTGNTPHNPNSLKRRQKARCKRRVRPRSCFLAATVHTDRQWELREEYPLSTKRTASS